MRNYSFLYEVLPFIYTVVGALSITYSEVAIGKLSGWLLISAALLIFKMRINYRTDRADDAEALLEQERKAASASLLTW